MIYWYMLARIVLLECYYLHGLCTQSACSTHSWSPGCNHQGMQERQTRQMRKQQLWDQAWHTLYSRDQTLNYDTDELQGSFILKILLFFSSIIITQMRRMWAKVWSKSEKLYLFLIATCCKLSPRLTSKKKLRQFKPSNYFFWCR